MRISPFIAVACTLAGLLQSCKHDPVSTTPDSIVIAIIPDSGSATIDSTTVFRILFNKGTPPVNYKVRWTMDTSMVVRVNVDSLKYAFHTLGPHSIAAQLLDSSEKLLASAATSERDTVGPRPVDTTSHAFLWSPFSIQEESSLNGCLVLSPTSIFAIGSSVYHFDGQSWAEFPIMDSRGFALHGGLGGFTIFGFSEKDLWFTNGSWASHFDGSKFYDNDLTKLGVMDLQTDGALLSAWGTSSSDMFFVGAKGTIVHFDGNQWIKYPKVTTKNLRSVWGTSHTDVWACGFNSSTAQTALFHFDGVRWTEDSISVAKGIYATGGFDAVWACDSSNGHHFVATSGAILLRKTDQGPWRSDSGLIPNRLPDGTFVGLTPFGNSANDFFVAGGWGFIAHWNGKSWYQYTPYFDYTASFYGAGGESVKGNTACIVGVKNGSSWILVGQRQ